MASDAADVPRPPSMGNMSSWSAGDVVLFVFELLALIMWGGAILGYIVFRYCK